MAAKSELFGRLMGKEARFWSGLRSGWEAQKWGQNAGNSGKDSSCEGEQGSYPILPPFLLFFFLSITPPPTLLSVCLSSAFLLFLSVGLCFF